MAHIKTYCRIKPSVKNFEDYDATSSTLYVRVPDHYNPVSWGVNVRPKAVTNHEFKFNGVFNTQASQEEVFNTAASSIVDGFLNGYNGTIFAYGQTGTGKTFTVEGAGRMYKDRGLAPRSLSMIYKALASRPSDDIEVHVSYMEIYQEIGYDLLNTAARTNSVVTPFPKVAVMEGAKGSCLIRNLSTHLAATEDVAQSLLLQGQANRKIAETPMNQRSSRSHAVFSIYLTVKQQDSDIVSKSKLHLVDLAGSERVSKTGTIGLQLSEAKHINLSLHHLEGVIVALQREVNGHTRAASRRPATASSALDYKLYNSMFRPRQQHKYRFSPYTQEPWRWVESQKSAPVVNKFVPYRNSLLTMVLRDSLGGNCQTAMIATISLETYNLSESISTCRFSQRVACVTNTLVKNEEIDDRSMIKRLRKKIAELESEISLLRSDQGCVSGLAPDCGVDSKLTDEDKLQCAGVVERYVTGRLKDPITAGVNSVLKFRECLRVFRMLVLSQIDVDQVPPLTASTSSPANVLTLSKSSEDLTRPSKSAWGEETSPKAVSQSNLRSASAQSLRDANPQFLSSNVKAKQPQLTQSQSFKHMPNHSSSPNPFMPDKPYRPKLKNGRQAGSRRGNNGGNSEGWRGDNKDNNRPGGGVDQRGSSGGDSRPGSGSSGWTASGQTGSIGPQRSSSAPAGTRGKSPVNGKAGPYKSPFERKKEQEIIKLDKKIEKANVTISSQKQDLKDIRQQQLILLRQEVSGKASKTVEQLADQHAYIQRLKKSGTDTDLVEQEEIVKSQLIKRQHKMEKRLGAIDQELNSLKDKEDQGQPKVQTKRSPEKSRGVKVEEKFCQFVRRDGKLDSRRVMDMLQSRDKRQEKLQDKLELEKQMALTSQVQMKEAATRQKLQEFRDKLRQSRTLSTSATSSMYSFDESTSEHHQPNETVKAKNGQGPTPQTSPLKASSEIMDNQTSGNGVLNNHTREVTNCQSDMKSLSSVSLVSSEVFTDSMVSFGDFPGSSECHSFPDTATTNPQMTKDIQPGKSSRDSGMRSASNSSLFNKWVANNSLKSSLSDLEKLRATSTPVMKAEPSKQWDSAYSTRQKNNAGFNIGPASNLDSVHSQGIQMSPVKEAGYEDFPVFANSQSNPSENGHEDSDSEDISVISTSKSGSVRTQPVSNNNDPFGTGYFSQGPQKSQSATDPFSPGYFRHSQKAPTRENDFETDSNASTVTLKGQGSNGARNMQVPASKHSQSNKHNLPDNDNLESMSMMGSVENITDYEKTQMLEQSHLQGNTESGQRKIQPTKMDSKPEFDGRKFGLNHNNFDEALSRMLGVDPSPANSLTIGHQQYDTYARTNRLEKPSHQSRKPKTTSYKPVNREADTKSHSSLRSFFNTWGPEAKNISISDRLSSYLNDSSELNQPVKTQKFHSFEDSDISPYKKPTVAPDASHSVKKSLTGKPKPDIDLDKFKVPIKALKEEEREERYMSSAQAQKVRVQRIRRARNAAEVIQRCWKRYKSRK